MNYQNLNPQELSISAIIVATILTDNLTANEINSLGNWFCLVGQYLETYAAFQTQKETTLQNININTNSHQFRRTNNPFQTVDNSNLVLRNEIEKIKRAINLK